MLSAGCVALSQDAPEEPGLTGWSRSRFCVSSRRQQRKVRLLQLVSCKSACKVILWLGFYKWKRMTPNQEMLSSRVNCDCHDIAFGLSCDLAFIIRVCARTHSLSGQCAAVLRLLYRRACVDHLLFSPMNPQGAQRIFPQRFQRKSQDWKRVRMGLQTSVVSFAILACVVSFVRNRHPDREAERPQFHHPACTRSLGSAHMMG